MESQVLHTAWCNISGEAAGEIWLWSLLFTATSGVDPELMVGQKKKGFFLLNLPTPLVFML